MGSEVYVHFNVPGDPVTAKEVVEALVVDAPEDQETRQAAQRARGAGVSFVARLDRNTRAREREQLELGVDVTRLHFFDHETGLAIDSECASPKSRRGSLRPRPAGRSGSDGTGSPGRSGA
jgi:multiple sugar transport system ATP-binding protein